MSLDYYSNVDYENFDPQKYILDNYGDQLELLGYAAGRRALTKFDPLLFACVYLLGKLQSEETGNQVSMSLFHMEQFEWARHGLVGPKGYKQERRAIVAGRGFGKSTLYFLILPLWALAHRHKTFVVAFANTTTQAEDHLSNFRRQINENQVLRSDYPELCTAKKDNRNASISDTKGKYVAKNGTVFAAKGMDKGSLGLNEDGVRPDWQIYDDIEPDASNYSAFQASKRLDTLRGACFYQNTNAVVTLVGTVTMYDSIIHQILKKVTSNEVPQWVLDEKIECVYYPAIVTDDHGIKRSAWEQRYPIADMLAEEHTNEFQRQMMNNPRSISGGLWTSRDFVYGSMGLEASRWLLVLDPASTTGVKSDQTGVSVIGSNREQSKCEVKEAYGVKLAGEDLRREVLSILNRNPKIKLILVESNVAGEHWSSILHGMPIEVKTQHTSKGKGDRFALAHDWYQKGMVLHPEEHSDCEGQMLTFPLGKNDDIADAVVLGVTYFLQRTPQVTFAVSSQSYV